MRVEQTPSAWQGPRVDVEVLAPGVEQSAQPCSPVSYRQLIARVKKNVVRRNALQRSPESTPYLRENMGRVSDGYPSSLLRRRIATFMGSARARRGRSRLQIPGNPSEATHACVRLLAAVNGYSGHVELSISPKLASAWDARHARGPRSSQASPDVIREHWGSPSFLSGHVRAVWWSSSNGKPPQKLGALRAPGSRGTGRDSCFHAAGMQEGMGSRPWLERRRGWAAPTVQYLTSVPRATKCLGQPSINGGEKR
jgi:hypothetical protein